MVSVIIPYYNRPEKIRRCLDSVLNQTYQKFEVLVIDDCSTDPLIIDNDPRIKVFRNEKNLGPGLSRNVGLDNAAGKHIAFLDSDDYWSSDFLKKCLKGFEVAINNPVMVFANTFSVTKDGVSPRRVWQEEISTILPNILIDKRPWATSACVWKAKVVKNIKWIDSRNWEDYAFDVSVALKCNNVFSIDEFLVFYDAEGNDKLSQERFEITIINQNRSILFISSSLFYSQFRNNQIVRKAITILLINHLISNLQTKSKNKRLIILTKAEFKKWNKVSLNIFIIFLSFFPMNVQLRTLRHLKKRIISGLTKF
ncbi:MAG TPA: glycosyltransferase family 2 protein [Aequorivita sp.]|nr:glycosyltransferase family 2 protein [Aequorivita sp.]